MLAGLVAAYCLTRLTALPPVDPEREPLDAIGVATAAVEAAGLLFLLRLRLIPQGGTR